MGPSSFGAADGDWNGDGYGTLFHFVSARSSALTFCTSPCPQSTYQVCTPPFTLFFVLWGALLFSETSELTI